MIVLYTDFGLEGPYTGQVQAVLHEKAPGVPVVSLFADLPPFDIQAAACLLPAYAKPFHPGSVFMCVVDPGVGSARECLAARVDGRWFLAPDEGLLEYALRRAQAATCYRLPVPADASASFHGRDVFAPAAASVARNDRLPEGCEAVEPRRFPDWPDDPARVLYIDRYGNAVTGIRAETLPSDARLSVAGRELRRAKTFSDVSEGEAFCYENSSGLIEIAVNRGRAGELPGLVVGSEVGVG